MAALRYVEEFRDPLLGRSMLQALRRMAQRLPKSPVRIM